MKRFADIHLHIASKFMLEKEGVRKNLWDFRRYKKKHYNNRAKVTAYDQSSLANLCDGHYKLALSAIYPIEEALSDTSFARFIAKVSTGMPIKRLKEIRRKFPSIFSYVEKEYAYKKATQRKFGNRSFSFVKSNADLQNEDELKIVLTLEGGHCLHGLNHPSTKEGELEILSNLDKIKDWEHPVFFLTLSHFQWNYLAGQAWAVPIPGSLQGMPFAERLKPKVTGLTDLGKAVIKKCLQTSGKFNRRILIDVKHMHIDARFAYYNLIEKSDGKYEFPIIASHVAPSGVKNKEEGLEVDTTLDEHKRYDKFNPWKINLCDEEFKIIHKSGGMIGLSLDQRILGAGNKSFKRALTDKAKDLKLKRKGRQWFNLLFLENLFHIVKTIGEDGAWDSICIGSDYDGVIDPIDTCPTANHMDGFENALVVNIDRYYPDYKQYLYDQPDFKTALRKVLYSNLQRFVGDHLQ